MIVLGQCAGPEKGHSDLQEAKAHQVRAERNAQINDPHRHLEVRRDLSVCPISQTKFAPSVPTTPVNSAPANSPKSTYVSRVDPEGD